MKFCFALFTVICLISFAKTLVWIPHSLSIQGQLQILDTIYRNTFDSRVNAMTDIKSCFCDYYSYCNEDLGYSYELQNVNEYIVSKQCDARGNYFVGYSNITKPSSIVPYKISDFFPAFLNSSFLANAICGTRVGSVKVANCIQPPIISPKGLTKAQMATLLNDFGTVMDPPSTVCTFQNPDGNLQNEDENWQNQNENWPNQNENWPNQNENWPNQNENYRYQNLNGNYQNPNAQADLQKLLSQYPQPIQNLFNNAINTACKKNGMNDIKSMAGFYLNVLCPPSGCTYPMLFH